MVEIPLELIAARMFTPIPNFPLALIPGEVTAAYDS